MQDSVSVQAPDWNLIQSLYLQGLSPKQIEAETGVKAQSVSVRASRKGWTAALAKVKQVVRVTEDSGEDGKENKGKLDSHSERARRGLAAILTRSIDKIQTLTLPSAKVALKVNQELESVVRNAKTVFGWSDSTQAPAIRIGVLAQVTIQPALPSTQQGTEPLTLPVIDIVTEQGTEPEQGT